MVQINLLGLLFRGVLATVVVGHAFADEERESAVSTDFELVKSVGPSTGPILRVFVPAVVEVYGTDQASDREMVVYQGRSRDIAHVVRRLLAYREVLNSTPVGDLTQEEGRTEPASSVNGKLALLRPTTKLYIYFDPDNGLKKLQMLNRKLEAKELLAVIGPRYIPRHDLRRKAVVSPPGRRRPPIHVPGVFPSERLCAWISDLYLERARERLLALDLCREFVWSHNLEAVAIDFSLTPQALRRITRASTHNDKGSGADNDKVRAVNFGGMSFVPISAGAFVAGRRAVVPIVIRDGDRWRSHRGASRPDHDRPRHLVRLKQDFWMARTEVTIGQFRRFLLRTKQDAGVLRAEHQPNRVCETGNAMQLQQQATHDRA